MPRMDRPTAQTHLSGQSQSCCCASAGKSSHWKRGYTYRGAPHNFGRLMIHTKNAATPNSSPCCPVCGYTFAVIEAKFCNLTIVTSYLATYVSFEDNPDVHFTHSESVILAVLAMAKGRVVPKTMLY